MQDTIFLDTAKALQIIKEKYEDKTLINAGGCGIFARLIARAFKQRGYDVSFVMTFGQVYVDCGHVDITNEAINNNDAENAMRTGWRHILVKVGDTFIDSTGVYTSLDKYLQTTSDVSISEPFSLPVLDTMLSRKNRHRWQLNVQ